MNQWASEKKSEALYGCGRVTESIGPSFEDPTYGRTVISYKYQGKNVQEFRVQNASRIFNLPESSPNMPQNPSPIFASTYGRTLSNLSFQTRDASATKIPIQARNIEKQPELLFHDLCARAMNSPTAELTFTFSAHMRAPTPITGLRIEFISSMMTSAYQSLEYFFVRFLRYYEAENRADNVQAVVFWQDGLKMYFSSEGEDKFLYKLKEYGMIHSFFAFNRFLETHVPIKTDNEDKKEFLVHTSSENPKWEQASEDDVVTFRKQNASRILFNSDPNQPIKRELKPTFLVSTSV